MDKFPLPDNIRDVIYSVISKVVVCLAVSKVYLYGSYYTGTSNEESDLDLAFFIKNNENLLEAHRIIVKITSKYSIDIQPQVFHECELDECIGIVEEIIENGGEISIVQNTES